MRSIKSHVIAFDNKQASTKHRHDLGGHVESKVHNLSQLMWPSLYVPELSLVIEKCVSVAKVLQPNVYFDLKNNEKKIDKIRHFKIIFHLRPYHRENEDFHQIIKK